MSDRRHTQRPALPEGYQFGDARPIAERIMSLPPNCRFDEVFGVAKLVLPELKMEHDENGNAFVRVPRNIYDAFPPSWRAPHENAAEQLARSHVHDYSRYDPAWHAYRCLCGAIGSMSNFQRTGDEAV